VAGHCCSRCEAAFGPVITGKIAVRFQPAALDECDWCGGPWDSWDRAVAVEAAPASQETLWCAPAWCACGFGFDPFVDARPGCCRDDVLDASGECRGLMTARMLARWEGAQIADLWRHSSARRHDAQSSIRLLAGLAAALPGTVRTLVRARLLAALLASEHVVHLVTPATAPRVSWRAVWAAARMWRPSSCGPDGWRGSSHARRDERVQAVLRDAQADAVLRRVHEAVGQVADAHVDEGTP